MSEPRQAPFGRADKAACLLLRARLYLNAEVYTGQPRWNDAITYAQSARSLQWIRIVWKLRTTFYGRQ